MTHPQLRGLSRRRAGTYIVETRSPGARSGAGGADVSRHLLGRPYKPNPLIGSAAEPEVFTASFDGFDCVTYIETVLALARTSSVGEFVEALRKIRYERGRVQWARRNHYMTGWIRNNLRAGVIGPVGIREVPVVSRDRVLNLVEGIPATRTRVVCVPKRAVARLAAHLHDGDLIFFASTRRNLDVFHAGFIVRDGPGMLMRHASRSAGAVVEQQLREFLESNRMAGVIVVRPREIDGRIKSISRMERIHRERRG